MDAESEGRYLLGTPHGKADMRRLSLLALLLATGSCRRPEVRQQPREPGEAERVTITTRDFAIDAPDSLPAGLVRLSLVNQGPNLHHVQFYRLPDSIGYDDAVARLPAREPLPDWLVPVGGAEGADQVGRTVVVMFVLEPGHYLLLCRFETDGVLHFHRGMTHHLVVTGRRASTPIELPPADAVITLSDYAFTLSGPLEAGRQLIRVENRGPSEHHLALARLLDGHGIRDVLAELAETDPGPTFEVMGGTAGLGPGRAMLYQAELEPGRYVLLCLVPDGDTGREHAELGMIREVDIAK